MSKIKVLAIDDSAVVRKYITEELNKKSDIEVIATAMDPYIAAEKIKSLQPDVLTLDIEMPRMDGLTFLEKLMLVKPMPVIMVSSYTEKGASQTIRAMELGAFDYILKPAADEGGEKWLSFGDQLAEKIRVSVSAKIKSKKKREYKIQENKKQFRNDNGVPSNFIIAIGASTGGTEVISQILTSMPENVPGIVVTQHMPPKFTEAFANRINSLSKINVKEASNGDIIFNGCAYIAPGGKQMLVRNKSGKYVIEVNDDPPRNRHKPSVDVLFESVSLATGSDSVGIILTGMGNDGAAGLKEMKQNGSHTIAQDEASCIVFGMPREAIKRDAASEIKNIEQIISHIVSNYATI